MDQDYFTIAEVAKRLKLHIKTVLIYVREGRLKATRIGKQYRVSASDLAAFAGGELPKTPDVPRHRHVEISSIVEVDAISAQTANRAVTHLQGALRAGRPGDTRARLDTIYYEESARLKLIISASLATTRHLLGLLNVLLED